MTFPSRRGTPKSPREVGLIARVAVGWALVSVVGVVVFAIALAPRLGATFDVHLVGRRSTGDFPVETASAVTLSFALAAIFVFFALVAAAMTSMPVRLAHLLAGSVCFLAPVLPGILLPNAVLGLVDPDSTNEVVVFAVGIAGLVGLLLGGATMVFGPIIVEAVQSGRRAAGRPSSHGGPGA